MDDYNVTLGNVIVNVERATLSTVRQAGIAKELVGMAQVAVFDDGVRTDHRYQVRCFSLSRCNSKRAIRDLGAGFLEKSLGLPLTVKPSLYRSMHPEACREVGRVLVGAMVDAYIEASLAREWQEV